MQLRNATPDDADAIARVSARSNRDAYEPIVDDESIIEVAEDPGFADGVRSWLAEIHDDDGVVVLVATVEDVNDAGDSPEARSDRRVVGFAQCPVASAYRPDELEDGEAYLKSLYVDPDWQGRGIGTELLEAAVDRADADAVLLDVLRANDDAREFYEERVFEYVTDTTVELGGAEYETARYRRVC